MPGTAKAITDSSGKSSLSKLRTVDPALVSAVDIGLALEILARKMEVEKPEFCSATQPAMHSKRALPFFIREMQAFSKLCSLAAGAVSTDVDVIRLQLAHTMPQFAEDENFLDACRFIVDIGSVKAAFVEDLMAFHQQFADPKFRRVGSCPPTPRLILRCSAARTPTLLAGCVVDHELAVAIAKARFCFCIPRSPASSA